MTDEKKLEEYVAFCATCGGKVDFGRHFRLRTIDAVTGECDRGHRWSFVFDMDESGTFGVMSFQCDNKDRIE